MKQPVRINNLITGKRSEQITWYQKIDKIGHSGSIAKKLRQSGLSDKEIAKKLNECDFFIMAVPVENCPLES